jgi:hypothetical protein
LKCIELYKESLLIPNIKGWLPLHALLRTRRQYQYPKVTPVKTALMVVDQGPAAVRHHDNYGNLPIWVECYCQARYPVVAKCIELYPQSLMLKNCKRQIPWSILTWFQIRVRSERNYSALQAVLKLIVTTCPEIYYCPWERLDPCLWTSDLRRMIFSLHPICRSSPKHLREYRDMNYTHRAVLLYLSLRVRILARARTPAPSLVRLLCMIRPPHEQSRAHRNLRLFMIKMIHKSSIVTVNNDSDEKISYVIRFVDDGRVVEDVFLRMIFTFL